MKIIWDKVTSFSKFCALIFFLLILPLWIVYVMNIYKETSHLLSNNSSPVCEGASCTKEKQAIENSGVMGTVTIGAKCSETERSKCSGKPYSAHLKVTYESGKVITQTFVSPDGKFLLLLPPGSYMIYNGSDKNTVSFSPQKISVEKNKISSINLYFESNRE